MQLIYERMLGGEGGPTTLDELVGFVSDDADDQAYIDDILSGVAKYQNELDALIARSTTRDLQRIPLVNRAILQLALYELDHRKDSPDSAVINEAVELAKRFGEEGDGRFVNGVLGSILRDRRQP